MPERPTRLEKLWVTSAMDALTQNKLEGIFNSSDEAWMSFCKLILLLGGKLPCVSVHDADGLVDCHNEMCYCKLSVFMVGRVFCAFLLIAQ